MENDGAAGWQFMSAKYGRAWMGADVPRGPWPYDGEIDLGFGGALRMAATVLTRDPIFGWFAYGGKLTAKKNKLSIIPRDGLRQRFFALANDDSDTQSPLRRLKLELDRDGFAAGEEFVIDKSLKRIAFTLENRLGDSHTTGLWLSTPPGTKYSVREGGSAFASKQTGDWDYHNVRNLRRGAAPQGSRLWKPNRLSEHIRENCFIASHVRWTGADGRISVFGR